MTAMDKLELGLWEANRAYSDIQRDLQAVLDSHIDDRISAIDVILSNYGLNRESVSSTATEPAEEFGLETRWNAQTKRIEIGTDRETLVSFPLETPYTTIRDWARNYEREMLAALPY